MFWESQWQPCGLIQVRSLAGYIQDCSLHEITLFANFWMGATTMCGTKTCRSGNRQNSKRFSQGRHLISLNSHATL